MAQHKMRNSANKMAYMLLDALKQNIKYPMMLREPFKNYLADFFR